MKNENRKIHRSIAIKLTLFIVVTASAGCSDSESAGGANARNDAVEQDATVSQSSDWFSPFSDGEYESLSERELVRVIKTSERPIMVEFGVRSDCARCEQMAPCVDELTRHFSPHAIIVQVPFNPSSSLQAQLGVRICPSYRFYRDGRVVDRCDAPTTLPVLRDKLSRLVEGAVDSRPVDASANTEQVAL